MAPDLSPLAARYLTSCRKQGVLPNSSILSNFLKVKHQILHQEQCILEIFIDQLTCSDFPPLLDALSATNLSGIDAVDVCQRSSNISLKGEYILSLLHAVKQKLRVVDLVDWSFWKDILGDICHKGITCRILNLRFNPIQKLNMDGKFLQLHTLNLDFSIHLTSFQVSCFTCMPKLMHLSMCATRVTNLWMTSAALSKLCSLVELRFQNCLHCVGSRPCPIYGDGVIASARENIYSGQQHWYSNVEPLSLASKNTLLQNIQYSSSEETPSNVYSDDYLFTSHELLQGTTEESSDESGLNTSSNMQGMEDWAEIIHDDIPELGGQNDMEITVSPPGQTILRSNTSSVLTAFEHLKEVMYSSSRMENGIFEMNYFDDLNRSSSNCHTSFCEYCSLLDPSNLASASTVITEHDEGCPSNVLNPGDTAVTSYFATENHISHHPSPICFEKYYREYMIYSLPHLKVLDNLPIKNVDREKAKVVFKKCYEYVPYNRQYKESVVHILHKREMGSSTAFQKPSQSKQPYSRDSCLSFNRSLSAAKVCSSPWPRLHPLSNFKNHSSEDVIFRPRQFEYHPFNPSLMVFGTVDGDLVVINHERQKIVGYLPSIGTLHSILGLCWLKKYPSRLIAGSDNGYLRLYDVCKMPSTVADRFCGKNASLHTFDEFEQLTSVHINSTDDYFLVSGFSKHVALYDIGCGKRLQILKDLHQEHINVVKFAHHSPSIFATASFDQDVKMWDLRQGTSHPCFTASSSSGNVMVCFSPDDHYLLASAIDNEVKQLLAVDGRLLMDFQIAPVGSAQNYTRSYYMNGRDYIISGSCEENVVRVCCAQTGKRLRDLSFEGKGSEYSMFVQSLRGDPFRMFHMSVLAAYLHPHTKSEIIKVNLLSSGDCIEEDSFASGWRAFGMGG